MSVARDIAFGRHSFIPECCIAFYISGWENHWTTCSEYAYAVKQSAYNYVPCPACFMADRKVKIRNCAVECKRECWKDF